MSSFSRDKQLAAQTSFSHRLAVLTDLDSIVAIYNDTISSRMSTADTELVINGAREQWFLEHALPHRPLWVVEQQGSVVAWLSYSNFYGRPAYAGTAELSIYVHRSYRQQGLGRYLLGQAVAHAPKIGIHTLLGFVFGHNHPSLQLFERFGFSRYGEMPGVAILDGIERDLIIVGKKTNV